MALTTKIKKVLTKKPAKASKDAVDSAPAIVAIPTGGRDFTTILKHARITEKASMHSAQGVYVFEISERATKRDISMAIKAYYKVTPRKISVTTIPGKVKRNARTGRIGYKIGGRKAYVYLKKGETINVV